MHANHWILQDNTASICTSIRIDSGLSLRWSPYFVQDMHLMFYFRIFVHQMLGIHLFGANLWEGGRLRTPQGCLSPFCTPVELTAHALTHSFHGLRNGCAMRGWCCVVEAHYIHALVFECPVIKALRCGCKTRMSNEVCNKAV